MKKMSITNTTNIILGEKSPDRTIRKSIGFAVLDELVQLFG